MKFNSNWPNGFREEALLTDNWHVTLGQAHQKILTFRISYGLKLNVL